MVNEFADCARSFSDPMWCRQWTKLYWVKHIILYLDWKSSYKYSLFYFEISVHHRWHSCNVLITLYLYLFYAVKVWCGFKCPPCCSMSSHTSPLKHSSHCSSLAPRYVPVAGPGGHSVKPWRRTVVNKSWWSITNRVEPVLPGRPSRIFKNVTTTRGQGIPYSPRTDSLSFRCFFCRCCFDGGNGDLKGKDFLRSGGFGSRIDSSSDGESMALFSALFTLFLTYGWSRSLQW